MSDERKKRLVLHIEIEEFYADDLQEQAAEYGEDDLADDGVFFIVTEEMMRSQVGLTLVTMPGEKCLNSDFDVHSTTARIVGAHVQDAGLRESIAKPEPAKDAA